MAECNVIYPTTLENLLRQAGERTEEAAAAALQAGAVIVKKKLMSNARAAIRDGSGEMLRGLKISKVQKTKRDGSSYIAIAFEGYDTRRKSKAFPRGIPNALKARVMESGKNGTAGIGFMKAAKLATEQDVERAMVATINQMLLGG